MPCSQSFPDDLLLCLALQTALLRMDEFRFGAVNPWRQMVTLQLWGFSQNLR